MLPEVDNVTIFLGAVVLALLSIYTIEKCRKDSTEHLRDPGLFLFEGKTRAYSLASNLGAVFSVTYFFGATFIYGHIFRGGLIIVAAVMFILVAWLFKVILGKIHKELPVVMLASQKSNILLDFLRAKLSPRDFKTIVLIYAAIYFGLLVEELAVSRLVLATLFSFHPAVTTIMLATICFIIVTYLYFGGFRAVLISDYEQLKVVAPFAAMLAFLIYRDSRGGLLSSLLQIPRAFTFSKGALAVTFGIAWCAAGLDFYSRLNFRLGHSVSMLRARKELMYVSLASIFLLLLVGIVFGEHLVSIFPHFDSPSDYTKASISYFLTGSRITTAIFFVGLFCMIFTTLNVLLLTLMQVGHYFPLALLKREGLLKLLLVTVVISTAMRFDSVSAVGVFIGSLMILPFLGIVGVLAPRFRLFPGSLAYLVWALPVSILIFALLFRRLENEFELHFFIPGIVLGTSMLCLVIARLTEITRRRWSNAKDDNA